MLQPTSKEEETRPQRRTQHEQREVDTVENTNAPSLGRYLDLQQPSLSKAASLERSRNVETSDRLQSAMPSSATVAKSRTLGNRYRGDQYGSVHDYDLYGSSSREIYDTSNAMSGSSKVSPKRSSANSSPSKYVHSKLDSKMKNVQMADVMMGSSTNKRLVHSDPNVSSSYVQFMPIDHPSALGRGSPDGGIDVDKDYVERRYPAQSDHHIYHHIK